MDGLVAGVDRAVVHRTLDEHPLILVPGALPRDVAVGDAGVTPDRAEAGVSLEVSNVRKAPTNTEL